MVAIRVSNLEVQLLMGRYRVKGSGLGDLVGVRKPN